MEAYRPLPYVERANGYFKHRQLLGSLIVEPGRILFDARTSRVLNKLIGVLYAPEQLDIVVHTSPVIQLLRLSAFPVTKWLVLDDVGVPVGQKHILVALQWPSRRKAELALKRPGFSINELRIEKEEFELFLNPT